MIQEGIPPRNQREGIPTSIEYEHHGLKAKIEKHEKGTGTETPRSYRKDSHTSLESKRRRQLIAEEIIGDESHISLREGPIHGSIR